MQKSPSHADLAVRVYLTRIRSGHQLGLLFRTATPDPAIVKATT